jgi:hypothetical protein
MKLSIEDFSADGSLAQHKVIGELEISLAAEPPIEDIPVLDKASFDKYGNQTRTPTIVGKYSVKIASLATLKFTPCYDSAYASGGSDDTFSETL